METDTELESLTTVSKQSWPQNLAALSPLSVLTSGRNCHFRMSLCSRVKENRGIHASHLSVQGCLWRAKEAFYRPGMYK